MTTVIDINTIFRGAWAHTKTYGVRLVGWSIAFFLPVYILRGLGMWADNIFGALLSLAGVVLGIIVQIALLSFILSLARGQNPVRPATSIVWWKVLSLCAASILVGIGTVLGIIALIIPGIIFATATALTQLCIVDHSVGPIDGIKESMKLTKGNRIRLFFILVLLTVLNIIGALLFFVGLLVTIPLSFFVLVQVYRTLLGELATPAPVLEVATTA